MRLPILLFVNHQNIIANIRKEMAPPSGTEFNNTDNTIYQWVHEMVEQFGGKYGKYVKDDKMAAARTADDINNAFLQGVCFTTEEDMLAFILRWS